MARTLIALTCLAAIGGVGRAAAGDFRVYRTFPDSVAIVDFDAIGAPAKGYRTVSAYEFWRTPVHGPSGEGVVSKIAYLFDCDYPSVRIDDYLVWDRNYRVIARQPGPSPWRPIKDIKRLPEDFHRFCSPDPRAGFTGAHLHADGWQQAVAAARKMFGWPMA